MLNFGARPIRFEFRVDGVQILDTTAAPGGIPPLVLTRKVELTPGKHRLELYDPRNGDYQTEVFDVQAKEMTIEIRLLDARSELKTYYTRVIYM
ncbi:MAG TPA: hypothetical protein VH277_19855 [Gemmatimonadaceae bacterium]|nr:hypothetical protein [Gemmatimonadaceae bacterium]